MPKTDPAAYIKTNHLDRLINFNLKKTKTADPFAPESDDLVRLHRLIREKKPFTVLEFGVGFSTLIIADALQKNHQDWNNLKTKPIIRNRLMFQSFSVDASKIWIESTKKRFPKSLLPHSHFHFSPVSIGTFQGQLCHYYDNLPDVVADFIYLDAPDPKQVKGKINGLSFKCDERTVMAADLLLMESTFLPGTTILVDGRTNNARFLKNNFKRQYKYRRDEKADVSVFELVEPKLGKYNISAKDFFTKLQ